MWGSFLVKLILAQCILAVIIIVVLKNILDNKLIESAIRRIETWPQTEPARSAGEMVVISHKNLTPANKERILKAARERFSQQMNPVFKIDKGIMGGIVIKIGEHALEYSLKDRLHLALQGRDCAS